MTDPTTQQLDLDAIQARQRVADQILPIIFATNVSRSACLTEQPEDIPLLTARRIADNVRGWIASGDWVDRPLSEPEIEAAERSSTTTLVAEIHRLRAELDDFSGRVNELEARLCNCTPVREHNDYQRPAFYQHEDHCLVNEMAASLRREGLGDDEIAETLSGPRQASGPQTAARPCGTTHYQHPETVCTEPADHYQPTVDPHAGPLVLNGREVGRVAWDEPTAARPAPTA